MSLPNLNTAGFHSRRPDDETEHEQGQSTQPRPATTSSTTSTPELRNTLHRFDDIHSQWIATAQTIHSAPMASSSTGQAQTNSKTTTTTTTTIPPECKTTVIQPPAQITLATRDLPITMPGTATSTGRGEAKALTANLETKFRQARAKLDQAIKDNNIVAVAHIVRENPALLISRSNDKETVLTLATKLGSKEMVSHLILLDAEIYTNGNGVSVLLTLTNKFGFAPIHVAIKEKQLQLLDLLLDSGTPIDILTERYKTPLLLFAVRFNPGAIKQLLTYVPESQLIQGDRLGRKPMHFAAEWRSSAVLEQLLTAGCPAHDRDAKSRTPLHYAAMAGSENCAKILVRRLQRHEITAIDANGKNVVHHAAESNSSYLIKLIDSKVSGLFDLVDHDHMTPLALAVENAHMESMNELLDLGARPGSGISRPKATWPLKIAIKYNDLRSVRALFRQSKYKDSDIFEAALSAVIRNNMSILSWLIEFRLPSMFLNKKDIFQILEKCVEKNNPEMLQMLIDHFNPWFDLHSFDEGPLKLFEQAHDAGNFEVLQCLVKNCRELHIDAGRLQNILAMARQTGNYGLWDAISKRKLFIDTTPFETICDKFLIDPIAKEIFRIPKPLTFPFSILDKKTESFPSINAHDIALQLASGLIEGDSLSVIAKVFDENKVSGLLAGRMTDHLVRLCKAISPSENFRFAQAQYLIGHELARLAETEQLPVSKHLDNLSDYQAMQEKCQAHSLALAEAGATLLSFFEDKMRNHFVPTLDRVMMDLIGTGGTGDTETESAIANQLAREFGLLPVWATRAAKVCVEATRSAIQAYGRSFNSNNPPDELRGLLRVQFVASFNKDKKSSTPPAGLMEMFKRSADAQFPALNDLTLNQWEYLGLVIDESMKTDPRVANPALHEESLSSDDKDDATTRAQ